MIANDLPRKSALGYDLDRTKRDEMRELLVHFAPVPIQFPLNKKEKHSMVRNKLLVLLASAFLFCALTFMSIATPTQAHAASTATVSAHAVTPASCPPTLRRGSTGSWVKTLQNALNWDYYYGYFDNYPYDFQPYLAVDGQFGHLTENAVKDFQYIYTPTEIDGIVGPHTWHALGYC